jgi:hypothetical protein
MLLDSVPAMLSHWNGQRSTSETREGCEAIKALGDALSAAMHYIEWPFGRYEPQTGQKRPKDWHTYSIIIARLIVRTLIDAGEAAPGITHNSLVVQVTHRALIRLEVPNLGMLTPDAIGAHLARWNKKYGLTPKGIAALVTK